MDNAAPSGLKMLMGNIIQNMIIMLLCLMLFNYLIKPYNDRIESLEADIEDLLVEVNN